MPPAVTCGWSALRAAPSTIWRASIAAVVRRDDRPAPLQPHPARRAPRGADPRGAGAGARDVPGIRGGRRPRHVRRAARRRAGVLRAGREDARLPPRARPHAAGAAPRGGRRRIALGGAAARRRRISPSCSSGSTSSSPTRARRIARRCSTRRRARCFAQLSSFRLSSGYRLPGGRPAASRHLVASASSRPAAARRSDRLGRRVRIRPALLAPHLRPRDLATSSILVTVPFGDIATMDRLKSLGPRARAARAEGRHRPRRAPPVSLRAVPAARARARRGRALLLGARAKGASASRSRAASSRKRAAAYRSTRWRCSCARPSATSACSSTRSAAPCPDERGYARAWFDRGTRRPHPAGRAFLAILACACENLSARRFAEYLSLAQVPRLDEAHASAGVRRARDEDCRTDGGSEDASRRRRKTSPPPMDAPAPPTSDLRPRDLRRRRHRRGHAARAVEVGDADRRVGGHRRRSGAVAPAADGAGQRDAAPARRRAARRIRIRRRRRASSAICGTSGTCARSRCRSSICWRRGRRRGRGASGWTGSRRSRRWCCGSPSGVLRVLQQLRPMAEIGPVSLDEARDVIADRLQMLEIDPPKSRYGRVFVGGPQQARGRTFRVVFVAGLAERMFPQRPHEDPMLLDREMREPLDAGLAAAGGPRAQRAPAAAPRGRGADRAAVAVVSADRDRRVASARPELLRARRHARDHRPHSEAAGAPGVGGRVEGGAGLAWPAPAQPADAIDDLEHDLSVLRQLLQVEPRASVRGHAHYLLRLNEPLKRSVTARWARGRSQWTPYDGITRVTGMTRPMLESQRLDARPYSLSALQKYAACPYQFLLSAIYRLEPPPDIEPLQKLDPLTRGSIFHEAQARFFRALQAEGRLPVAEKDIAGRAGDARPRHRRGRREVRGGPRARHRSRLARRDRRHRPRPARLGPPPAAAPPAGSRRYFEFAFGLAGRRSDAIPRASRILCSSTAASSCAARWI